MKRVSLTACVADDLLRPWGSIIARVAAPVFTQILLADGNKIQWSGEWFKHKTREDQQPSKIIDGRVKMLVEVKH